jgi:bis(5'-nucleosyl)-tetraphosphatase (symmetrical)
MVLGNHETYLIARALGVMEPRRNDTLSEVLAAPDKIELIEWLRTRPLLHSDADFALVHAAIHPDWRLRKARLLAAEASAVIASDKAARWLRPMRKSPVRWHASLQGRERFQTILAGLTRLRCVDRRGRMADYAGPLDERPEHLTPWWQAPGRKPSRRTIIFGHWAALGLYQQPGFLGIDTGCVWGRRLTAVRLEDGQVFSVPATAAP